MSNERPTPETDALVIHHKDKQLPEVDTYLVLELARSLERRLGEEQENGKQLDAIVARQSEELLRQAGRVRELEGALSKLVAIVPEPPMVSMGFDSPPEHATMEDHELGYALHLARAALQEKP